MTAKSTAKTTATPAAKAVKATPAKAAAPAKATPKPAVKLPVGFTVKYDNGAYLLAKRGEAAAEGAPKWLVICTAHATTTPAEAAKAGDLLGRKVGRITWCPSCAE